MPLIRENRLVANAGTWHPYTGANSCIFKGLKSIAINPFGFNGLILKVIVDGITYTGTFATTLSSLSSDILTQVQALTDGTNPLSSVCTVSLDAGKRLVITHDSPLHNSYIQIEATTSVTLEELIGIKINQMVRASSYYQEYSDMAGVLTDGTENYGNLEPIYYRNVNRPLINLAGNDAILNKELIKILEGYDADSGNAIDREFIGAEGFDIYYRFYASEGWIYSKPGPVGMLWSGTTGKMTYNILPAVNLTGVSRGMNYIDGNGVEYKIYAVDNQNGSVVNESSVTLTKKAPAPNIGAGYIYEGYIKTGKGLLSVGLNTMPVGNDFADLYVKNDVEVNGLVYTYNATNLLVVDKFIHLNIDETGTGVTGNVSGMVVERGSLNDATFQFDETGGAGTVGAWGAFEHPIYNALAFYTAKNAGFGYGFGPSDSSDYICWNASNQFELHTNDVAGSWGVANKFVAAQDLAAPNFVHGYYFGAFGNNDYITYDTTNNKFLFYENSNTSTVNSVVEAGSYVSTYASGDYDGAYYFGAKANNDVLKYYDDTVDVRFTFFDNNVIQNSRVAAGIWEEYHAGAALEELHGKHTIVVGDGVDYFGHFNGNTEASINAAITSASDATTIYLKGEFTLSNSITINKNNITITGDKDTIISRPSTQLTNFVCFNITHNNATIKNITLLIIGDASAGFMIDNRIFYFQNCSNPTVNNINIIYNTIEKIYFNSYLLAMQNVTGNIKISDIKVQAGCTMPNTPIFFYTNNSGLFDIKSSSYVILENILIDLQTPYGANLSGGFIGAQCFLIVCYNLIDVTIKNNKFINGVFPIPHYAVGMPTGNNILIDVEESDSVKILNNLLKQSDVNSPMGVLNIVVKNNGYLLIDNNYIECGKSADSENSSYAGSSSYGIWDIEAVNSLSNHIITNNKIITNGAGDGYDNEGGVSTQGGYVHGIYVWTSNTKQSLTINNNIIENTVLQMSGNGGDSGAAGGTGGQGGHILGVYLWNHWSVTDVYLQNITICNNIYNFYYGDGGYAGWGGTGLAGSEGRGGNIYGVYLRNVSVSSIKVDNNILNLGTGGRAGTGVLDVYGGSSEAIFIDVRYIAESCQVSLCNNQTTYYASNPATIGGLLQAAYNVGAPSRSEGTYKIYSNNAPGPFNKFLIEGNLSKILWNNINIWNTCWFVNNIFFGLGCWHITNNLLSFTSSYCCYVTNSTSSNNIFTQNLCQERAAATGPINYVGGGPVGWQLTANNYMNLVY